MKKSKYTIMLIANCLIVLLSLILFRLGLYLATSFIIIQLLLVILNHIVATDKKSLMILDVNLIVSTIIANVLTFGLYYLFISSDDETLMVGVFALMVGVGYVSAISLISLLFKRER